MIRETAKNVSYNILAFPIINTAVYSCRIPPTRTCRKPSDSNAVLPFSFFLDGEVGGEGVWFPARNRPVSFDICTYSLFPWRLWIISLLFIQ